MGLVDKFWNFLGVEDEDKDNDDILETPISKEIVPPSNNVVSIHSNKTMKVVICEPTSFDEVQSLADHLKSRKQLILNFEKTPPEIAQRLTDFLSGTIYALDGIYEQLGTNIIAFAPNNMEFYRDSQAVSRKNSYSNSMGSYR
jgi:cell division inhibitor SepF